MESKWEKIMESNPLGTTWKRVPYDNLSDKHVMAHEVTCKHCGARFFYGVEDGDDLPNPLFCPYCFHIAIDGSCLQNRNN